MAGGTPTINTYVSDMLAVENHLLQPMKTQATDSDLAGYPQAGRVINEAIRTTESHIAALEARLEALGGHGGKDFKTGVAAAAGVVAGAIGQVRKTGVSKNLRDDYSALCLASAGYTMLEAAALGLSDIETAQLAKRHLADVAALVMKASQALPSVVLQELKLEGAAVDPAAAAEAERASEDAWKVGAARSN